MSRETFAFTSSTLRSLRLQREMVEWEDRRRAASRQSACRRYQPVTRGFLAFPRASRRPQYCRDPAVHNALYTGDFHKIKSIFKDETTTNLIVESLCEELAWSAELGLLGEEKTLKTPKQISEVVPEALSYWQKVQTRKRGMWVLTPQKQHTSPLRITSSRGYQDCVKHLLFHGAEVDAVVGGKAALHDSCANHRAECTRLLLSSSADPNILSEEGLAPLHLCTTQESLPCAQLLLEYGALVNQNTRDRRDSPLHVAAKHGLDDHVKLYLCYGANIGHRNREGETALNAACASADKPTAAGRYYRVVKRLLESGADAQIAGRKNHTPLHNACSNCHVRIVELLLKYGADVNVRNCAGYTPVDCALQAVEDYLEGEPEKLIATLVNHGAAPINPKMLKFCALSPRTMEVILNTYDRILSCDSWMESVPSELWQEYHVFYDSALCLLNQPRSLQHLARCAIRKQLGIRCHRGIAQLELPSFLQEYLHLPLEGYLK